MMTPKPAAEKWNCSYLANETDADFRRLRLREITRPEECADSDDPWSRLYSTPTVTSMLRYHSRTPRTDSLQLHLNSICDQFADWPISKQEVVRQLRMKDQKCFCKPVPKVVERPFDHPLYMAPVCEAPIDVNYIKLAIDCPHISQTNNGYSRKFENGTFYRS